MVWAGDSDIRKGETVEGVGLLKLIYQPALKKNGQNP